jgi:hypothetical protein
MRLVLVAAIFALLVPAPLFAFPLAALLLVSRPASRREFFIAVVAGGLSCAWLLLPGGLPDQVVRAGLVMSTVAFVGLSRLEGVSFTHRALVAIGLATAAVTVMFVAFGWSWDQLHWSVVSQRSYESRLAMAPLRANPSTAPMADGMEQLLEQSVMFEANNYAAFTALKLIAGLALATALYQRVAVRPNWPALGRFRDFRFSEHLGWAAAIPLVIVLLPGLVRAKVAAFNLLLLTGTLYALRGLAVAAFAAGLAGTGPLATALALTAAFFMLPVVIGVGIVLGVLDAGMDLRRRLTTPPAKTRT